MSRRITDSECRLYHTEYCDLLNMQSCEKCFVQEKKEYESIISDLDVLKTLLPEEGVHSLFESEACLFCKKKTTPRAYYALLDLGHPEPKRVKRSVVGLKVKSRTGSMLPAQISTCATCRRRMLTLEYLPVLLPILSGLLMLLIFLIPGVTDGMEKYSMLMPFALFSVVVALSAVVAWILKKSLHSKYSRDMHMSPFDIPLLAKMQKMGWFPLSTSGNTVRMVFTRNRMRQGLGTGTAADALAEQKTAQMGE